MRILVTTLSVIFVMIGLVLSILPFGYLAFIPIFAALIFTLMASKLFVREGKNTGIIKVLFTVIIISAGLSIYNALKPNEIAIDQEAIEKQEQSDKETLEELEDIEIED